MAPDILAVEPGKAEEGGNISAPAVHHFLIVTVFTVDIFPLTFHQFL